MAIRILILGYGNPDREDDGVAWHILARLADLLGQPVPTEPEEPFDEDQPITLSFSLQLTPDMAETISAYDYVWFVDAHTGRVPDEISVEAVQPYFQNSPFTHHFTPQSCLSMTEALYHRSPVCELVSVRGYSFGFHRQLSAHTQTLAEQAAQAIFHQITEIQHKP